jgi:AraC-like DNA-binding protein
LNKNPDNVVSPQYRIIMDIPFINKQITEFSSLNLDYSRYIPSGELAEVISQILEIKGQAGFKVERVLPYKDPRILINLGNHMSGKISQEIEVIRSYDYVIQGNRTIFFDHYMAKKNHFLMIEFKPHYLNKICGIPASEIINSQWINPKLKGFEPYLEKILKARNFAERVSYALEWIVERTEHSIHPGIVQYITSSLDKDPFMRVHKLESLSGYSRKYLARIFKESTGYSISAYRRLVRFEHVLNSLKPSSDEDWHDLIYGAEYYDQSHFIRDIKEISGLTPTVLLEKVKQRKYRTLVL